MATEMRLAARLFFLLSVLGALMLFLSVMYAWTVRSNISWAIGTLLCFLFHRYLLEQAADHAPVTPMASNAYVSGDDAPSSKSASSPPPAGGGFTYDPTAGD